MPPDAGRPSATGATPENQVSPRNSASQAARGGRARATPIDRLASGKACETDRSPAQSGGPDSHSSKRCVGGPQYFSTKRCVVGPQLPIVVPPVCPCPG